MEDRIKRIRKDAGLKQAEFAEKIGIKASTVTSYETGLRVPSDAVILSICREFGVSEAWLRNGVGPMYVEKDADGELKAVFAEIGVSDDELIKAVVRVYWRLGEKEKAAVQKMADDFIKEMQKEKPGQ